MTPSTEYIALVLGDYCDLQIDGIVPAANRYPVADVMEQIELLEHLKPVANEVLARRIAELDRQLSSSNAQRDNAWQELREIREAIGANPEESTADEVRRVVAGRDKALAQAEQLKGIKPELPPRPPQGEGLPRYGINWNGPEQPLTVPMDDGYWTPYHLALARNAELVQFTIDDVFHNLFYAASSPIPASKVHEAEQWYRQKFQSSAKAETK